MTGRDVRVGLYLSGQHPPGVSASAAVREHLEQVELARELGFASVWAPQHFLSDPFRCSNRFRCSHGSPPRRTA
jgi:alkanesulfonate monooxygenase SsuD/methylene tetrahydromethanopterin reductase-like flavin-dependent oxidoreductase (luciferase family)